jgi:exonuclease III
VLRFSHLRQAPKRCLQAETKTHIIMKIATWNIERQSKSSKRFYSIIETLKTINADILILTETNEEIDLGEQYSVFHTSKPTESFYKESETRVTIFSKYLSVGKIETFRSDTSICSILQTQFGELAVYGTIIGNYGNRLPSFEEDLEKQILDFVKISKSSNLCISGDLNISFSDNFYFTYEGRDKLNNTFDKLDLENLTSPIRNNIDHIVLPKRFIEKKQVFKEFWNDNYELCNHIGVAVTLR